MEPRRYLAVTCNLKVRMSLEALLNGPEAAVTFVDSKDALLAQAGSQAYIGVFLDTGCAGIAAAPLCRKLRALLPHANGALVLIGERREDPETVRGLDEGADDFWQFPFNGPVCLAYLRAILRRVRPAKNSAAPVLKTGAVVADPAQKCVTLGGKRIELRGKEFDLFYQLLKQRGKALSREVLMETAWGREYHGTTRTIDFHIAQLRQKLGPWGKRIETVSGVGYRLSTS